MTVFGRLDIHYPDGRSETHSLEGDTVAVGTADDNDIRIDAADIAPHHFHLNHSGGIVRLTDLGSELGTSIDSERLTANSPRVLNDIEEIAIGSLKLTFYQRSDSPTIAMSALSDQTEPLSLGLRAQLDRDALSVFPAASADVELTISNLADESADFLLETEGLPEGWTVPGRLVFPLAAEETSQLRLRIKPSSRADMPAGEYPLIIKLSRQGEPERFLQLQVLVTLGAIGGLSLALEPLISADPATFDVFLLNQGNEALLLRLSLYDPRKQLNLRLSQTALKLAPGAPAQISAVVTAGRRPLVGSARAIPFAIQVRAETASDYLVALPAHLTVEPRISQRNLALVVVAALVILLSARLLYQPPAPEIKSFNLSSAQVAQGTPVELTWTASDAERFVIEVDRVAIAELSADASSFVLETSAYPDPVEVALIARQGELTVISSRRLDAYQPVTVTDFSANKSAMLRHVNGTFTVKWAIKGAVSLQISQPPGFEILSARGIGEAEGEIVLRGAPVKPFQIVLSAEDETGARSEQRLDIAMREPECMPSDDAYLHSGPDSRFPRTSIAIKNVPVLVNATTATADWLKVELASGERGWGAASWFFCLGFDPAALRVVKDLPATPTDLPTPTATATPLPTATATDAPQPSPTTQPTPTPTEA